MLDCKTFEAGWSGAPPIFQPQFGYRLRVMSGWRTPSPLAIVATAAAALARSTG